MIVAVMILVAIAVIVIGMVVYAVWHDFWR